MKNAIVTGGSRGIGFGIAEALAEQGFNLCITGTKDSADEAVSALQKKGKGIKVIYIKGNNALADDRRGVFDGFFSVFDGLDLLVNNAGAAPKVRRDMLEIGEEELDYLIDINLKGTFFMCQEGAKRMAGRENAKIINISSVSAYATSVERAEYCISKAGISMCTALYAHRLADMGIRVYEIRPGIIQTDMTAKVTEKYDRLIAEGITPIRRWGQPDDIGRAVAAIASGAFDFSTGEVFNIDGGFHLRRF